LLHHQRFEELKDDKILQERLRSISYSYALIEALIETSEYYVKSSNLALAEVFHVVYNEIVSLKMYRLGIPLTLWSKLRAKHDLSKEEKFLVREVVSKYLKTFRNYAEIVNDIVDEDIYPKLVLEVFENLWSRS